MRRRDGFTLVSVLVAVVLLSIAIVALGWTQAVAAATEARAAHQTHALAVARAYMEEVRARDGRIVAFGSEGDRELAAQAERAIGVPAVAELLAPMLMAIPLQLLAYHVAVRLGRDVDQPRNLAKSVTVE